MTASTLRAVLTAVLATLLASGCSYFNRALDLVGLGDGSSRRVEVGGPTVGEIIAALPPSPVVLAAGDGADASGNSNAESPTADAASAADASSADDGQKSAATATPVAANTPVYVDKPELEAAIANYVAALPEIDDEHVARAVRQRVLDLKLEARALDADSQNYDDVIAEYEQLLAERPPGDVALGPSVSYQLARARDLAGQGARALAHLDALIAEAGQTPAARVLVQEANFRRGEAAFSRNEWATAAGHYTQAAAADSPYRQHAGYMLGWARYRNGETEAALAAFLDVIGGIVPDAAGDGLDAAMPMAELKAGERELLSDALRASVLSLERSGGVAALTSAMRARRAPSWQYVVYAAVGDTYVDQERFQDAAAVYDAYVAENADSVRAPAFALRAIDALNAGNLPAEAQLRKPLFVERYGRGSDFGDSVDEAVLATYQPALRTFIDELATTAHARAQSASGDSTRRADYLEAARWYRAWLANFDDDADARTGETLFLLGEALAAASEHVESVQAFAALGERFPEHARAREAAYAVVLGTQQVVRAEPSRAADLLAVELDFAARFRDDERAPIVQLHAAQSLLDVGDDARAATVAEEALAAFTLAPAQVLAARRIAADAQFARAEFAAAEAHYRAASPLAAGEDRAAIDARVLASVAEQARRAEASGETAAAVAHLERLAAFAPGSQQALQAGLDRAALLIAAGDLAKGAEGLEALRRAHAGDPLLADVSVRLADLYERQQLPAQAAVELERVAASAEAAVAGPALYRASELYREAGETAAETLALQRYVEAHPRPMPLAMEALARLLELEASASGKSVWRQRMLEVHASDTGSATPRSRFLAAGAAFDVADAARAAFEARPLAQPLRESLAAKRDALDTATTAYERASAFGVEEFVAGATFRIAGLYVHMRDAVLSVQPPDGLSEQARETYHATLAREAGAFVERAVATHEVNGQRAREGMWNAWIAQSFEALAVLVPVSYQRQEVNVDIVAALP